MRRTIVLIVAVALAAPLASCAGGQGLVRKVGPEYQEEVDSWHLAVDDLGRNGYWLVVRGYHRTDDLIAVASNAELSHAAVLDLDRREVIEAVGKGVIITPLDEFVSSVHRIQIVRPPGWTPEAGARALGRARSQVGKKYDFTGIVGLPSDKRFYCSEFAVWSMEMKVDDPGVHKVLHPKKLHKLGQLMFDSGPRDKRPDFRGVDSDASDG